MTRTFVASALASCILGAMALAPVAMTPVFAQEKTSGQPATTAATKAESKTETTQPAKATTVSTTNVARGYKILSRPLRGVVVDVNQYLASGKGTVTAAQATEAQQKGATLGLMVGSGRSAKIYFVTKADGSSAAADLARLADNRVGIVGKTVSRSNMNLVIADVIETMK